MEATLQQEFPEARIEAVRGAGGVFDVTVDDVVVFSKHQTGRFPTESEIVQALNGF